MKQTLSLCMIVKNEGKYLRDCLQSVHDLIDQIIIIDTGSTDNTVDIAQEFGAEVHHFKWVDDFSAARNESIKYATTDWILWIDADERIMPDSKNELKKLIRQEPNPVIYKVQINSIINNGASTRLSSAHRLFNNYKGLYFTGKIHEQIAASAAEVGAEERESNIILEHLGYDLNENDQILKDKRNLNLLQKSLKSDPKNGYAHYTIAQQYGLMKLWNKALQHYDAAEKLNQFDKSMMASLLNTKAEALFYTRKYNQAKEACKKSIINEPTQVGAYYMLFRIADVEKNTTECIENLEIILKNNRILQKSTKSISTDVLINEEKILFTLALNYLKLNHRKEAIVKLNEALLINPENQEIREKLVEVYLINLNFEKIKPHLEILINQFPDNENYKDMLGTILIKEQQFAAAINIYENLVLKNPENKHSIKKLIGLYGKTGELQKAHNLMQIIA